MKVISLNIGMPKKEVFGAKEWATGICKQPVTHGLDLLKLGFKGDGVADTKHHGGADKAVCVYSLDHYAAWEKILGSPLPTAAFGENLTVSGLREEKIGIGDIFKIGTARVQVSQPRQPCKTLAARFEKNDFVKLVVQSGQTGLYFRVLEEGMVTPGDEIMLLERDKNEVTVAFANHTYHHDRRNTAGIKKVLAVKALSASWRQSFEELLAKATG